jgi:hypothetical protein
MAHRLPLVVAVTVAVLGFGYVWVGGLPFEPSFDELCGTVPEGAGYSTEWALSPPGATRCVATLPDGATREHTYVPWRAWLSVLLFALSAGMGARALTVRRRRTAFGSGWLVLGIAALTAWFVGPG